MPQKDEKRFRTPQEFEDAGIRLPLHTQDVDETDASEISWPRYLGALGTRIGGGLISGTVGAVPSLITTPAAAGIGAGTEWLAEKIERPGVEPSKLRMGTEAGLSAIPMSFIYKAGKPILSNVIRGASLALGSNAVRRGMETGNPLPTTKGEIIGDLVGAGIGGGVGLIPVAHPHMQTKTPAIVPPVVQSKGEELFDQMAKNWEASHMAPERLVTHPVTEGKNLVPTGTRPAGDYAIRPEGNSRSIGEPAPISPGVAAKQAEILRKPYKVNIKKAADEGLLPVEHGANLDESAERAAALGNAQRKEHLGTAKVETKQVAAEQRADLARMKEHGGTSVEQQAANQQKAVNAADKQAKLDAENAKIAEAQSRIDAILNDENVEFGPENIADKTTKVDTPSGTRVLNQSIRVGKSAEEKAAEDAVRATKEAAATQRAETAKTRADTAKLKAETAAQKLQDKLAADRIKAANAAKKQAKKTPKVPVTLTDSPEADKIAADALAEKPAGTPPPEEPPAAVPAVTTPVDIPPTAPAGVTADKAVERAHTAAVGAEPVVPVAEAPSVTPVPAEAPPPATNVEPVAETTPAETPIEGPGGPQKVDLTRAATAKEVKNRILNSLNEYASKAKAVLAEYENNVGINEKGEKTLPYPDIAPLQLEVPGGFGMTVKPDQVDAAIAQIEKSRDDMWQSIVDAAPKAGTTSVKPNYGVSFAAKGESGHAPAIKFEAPPKPGANPTPYKGPHTPEPTPPKTPKGKPKGKGVVPVAVAPKVEPPTPRLVTNPKAESVPTPPATTTPARSLEDMSKGRKAAWDPYFKAKEAGADAAGLKTAKEAGMAHDAEMRSEIKRLQAEGKEIPEGLDLPNGAVKPKPAEDSSDRLVAMPPEEQAAALEQIVKAAGKKGRLKNQKGEVDPQLSVILGHAGLATAGALTGAAMNPDDPWTGAMLGLAAGGLGPMALRAAIKHINTNAALPEGVRNESMRKIGEKVKENIDLFSWAMLPDYYRASILSNPMSLGINSYAGPYGSAFMAAIEKTLAGEHNDLSTFKVFLPHNFNKEFKASWQRGKENVANAAERTEGLMGQKGPAWYRKTTAAPAELMSTGDEAARRILIKHFNFSEDEARAATLTSEPVSAIGKGVGKMRNSKSAGGNQSVFMHMLLPFWRTNVNQGEQGLMRVPWAGPYLMKRWGQMEPTAKRQMAQAIMTGSTGTVGWLAGRYTPEGQAKYMLKLINNLGGQYGTTASLAFVAGQTARKNVNNPNKSVTDQVFATMRSAYERELPLPSTQSIQSATKAVSDYRAGIKPSLPYGVVPAIISSKDQYSIPSLMRSKSVGDLLSGGVPTKNEHSLAAPFEEGLTDKKMPTGNKLTPGQQALKARRERMAAIRKARKERLEK